MLHDSCCVLRVLGIDPGTATTGWAILEVKNGKEHALAFGHITTSKRKSDHERLEEMANDLDAIIKKFKPQECAVEEIFFFKNAKTVIRVSQSRGAILLTLKKAKVEIFEYTPLQVKQALTGYGRAEKKQMQEMVKAVFGLKKIPKPDDAADALAIALCHSSSRKNLLVD